LLHHAVSGTPERLRTNERRVFLQRLRLPADARERIEIALRMIDAIETQILAGARAAPARASSDRLSSADAALRDGRAHSLITLCELGDVQRPSASRMAVRMAGIDIGVSPLEAGASERSTRPP
jgi:hypothetical protein